jgi:predicted nucleic acid-binding protein
MTKSTPRFTRTAPSSGVRLVLDTNTALSELPWDGPPARLIDAAEARSARRVCLLPGVGEHRRAGSDFTDGHRRPTDDSVLAAAAGGNVDLIGSGDAHLLNMKSFMGIEIVTAATVVGRIDPQR